jgi:hypothetical protein
MSKYIDGVNEENMDRFLAALRSGEFEQGRYALNTEGTKFCCMGVMSELAHRDGVVDKDDSFYEVRYGGLAGLPVSETLDWLGIPESQRRPVEGLGYNISLFNSGIPYLSYKDHVTPSELNDARGLTFAEIADAFEQEFTKEV